MLYHYTHIFPTPVGEMTLFADETGLRRILPGGYPCNESIPCKTPLIQEAIDQLEEYFSGARKDFTLPLAPQGTSFQRAVWLSLSQIPYGTTESYKELALRVGCPKGFQAVGQANARNPLPFLFPCHRVIAADGAPGGYVLGPDLKAWLLTLERTHR